MATIYLSGGVVEHAQAVIDEHIVSCTLCGTNQLCGGREGAERVFAERGLLPRRKPGLVNPVEDSAFGWFAPSTVPRPATRNGFAGLGQSSTTP